MPVGRRELAWGPAMVSVALVAACNAVLGNADHAVGVADAAVNAPGSSSGVLGGSGSSGSVAAGSSGASSGKGGSSSGVGHGSSGSGAGGSSSGSSGGGSGSSSSGSSGGTGSSGGSSSGAGSSSSGGAYVCPAGSGCTLSGGTVGVCDLCGDCVAFDFSIECPAPDCSTAPERAPCSLGNGSNGECCGGVCSDPFTDNANCGGCGQVCPQGSACSNESCAQSCGSSAPCAAGQTCIGGVYCGLTSCAGATDGEACSNPGGGAMCCGGACVLFGDPNNCGACGNKCASGICGKGVVFVNGPFGGITVCVPEGLDGGTACTVPGGCPTGETCLGEYCVTTACSSTSPTTAFCAAADGNVGVCVDKTGTPPFPCEDGPM